MAGRALLSEWPEANEGLILSHLTGVTGFAANILVGAFEAKRCIAVMLKARSRLPGTVAMAALTANLCRARGELPSMRISVTGGALALQSAETNACLTAW
jgi:hypothetical protein